jgi:serine/threonine-protein kinase HipA
MHIEDSDFALEDGLLPKNIAKGKIPEQFQILAEKAEIGKRQVDKIFESMLSNSEKVTSLIDSSFLNESSKRNYLQAYQTRLKKLQRT